MGGLTGHSLSCLEAVSRFCAICHHRSIGHSCFSSSFLWRRDRSKESYGISDISSHPTIMPLIKHQFAFAVSTGSNVYFPAALPVVGQHFFLCVCVSFPMSNNVLVIVVVAVVVLYLLEVNTDVKSRSLACFLGLFVFSDLFTVFGTARVREGGQVEGARVLE